jgi:hypothetical protein
MRRKSIDRRHVTTAEIDNKQRRRISLNYVLEFADLTDRQA